MRRIATFLFAMSLTVLSGLSAPNSAQADDIELYLWQPDPSLDSNNIMRPNILLMFSGSAKMATPARDENGALTGETRLDQLKEGLLLVLDMLYGVNIGFGRFTKFAGGPNSAILYPVDYIEDEVLDADLADVPVSDRVSASENDVEESQNGSLTANDPVIEMVTSGLVQGVGSCGTSTDDPTYYYSSFTSTDHAYEDSGGTVTLDALKMNVIAWLDNADTQVADVDPPLREATQVPFRAGFQPVAWTGEDAGEFIKVPGSANDVPWVKKKVYGDWESPYEMLENPAPEAGRLIKVANMKVTVAGNGTVTATANASINCNQTNTPCTDTGVDNNVNVTLSAAAADGYTFEGWSGGCSGTGSCTVNVKNNAPGDVTATFSATATNTAPTASDTSASVTAGDSVNINLSSFTSDDDDDALTYSTDTAPTNGDLSWNGSTATYTSTGSTADTDSFVYKVDDNNGGTATATVSITINAPVSGNNDPVATNDSATVAEGGSITIDVVDNDTDVDNDSLTVSNVGAPANGYGGVQNNNDGTITYNHLGGENIADSFTYTISDSNGGTDTATVSITITNVNDAPVANNDTASVANGGTLNQTTSVLDNDTDAENDTLSVATTPVTDVSNGTLTLNANGTYTYVHNGSATTSDSFEYRVNDGNTGSDTATVTISITGGGVGTVTGTIYEDGDSDSVADNNEKWTGYTVILVDSSATEHEAVSDNQGVFTFSGIPAGNITISTPSGYTLVSGTDTVTVTSDGTHDLGDLLYATGSGSSDSSGDLTAAWRYVLDTIPKDATIHCVEMEMSGTGTWQAGNNANDSEEMNLFVENSVAASEFTASANNLTGRSKNAAGSFDAQNTTLSIQNETLKTAFQALVNNTSWGDSNSVAFLAQSGGGSTPMEFNPGVLLNVAWTPASEDDINSGGGSQLVGLRFENLTIPSGVTISDAQLTFRSASTQVSDASLIIAAEKVGGPNTNDGKHPECDSSGNVVKDASGNINFIDNLAPFTSEGLAGRVKCLDGTDEYTALTDNQFTWNITETWNEGTDYSTPAADDDANTIDLKDVLQEVIGDASANTGWCGGSANTPLNLIIRAASGSPLREFLSYDNEDSPTLAPQLRVTYDAETLSATSCVETTHRAKISYASDDVEEVVIDSSQPGAVYLDSSTLNIVASSSDTIQRIVGLRFEEIPAEQGATIISAKLGVTAYDETPEGGVGLTGDARWLIYGEERDANSFSSSANSLSERLYSTYTSNSFSGRTVKSDGSITENPRAISLTNGDDDWVGEQTYELDVTGVVQQIVSNNNWSSHSDMAFYIVPDSAVSSPGQRDVYAYDLDPLKAPTLTVKVRTVGTSAGSSSSGMTVRDYMKHIVNTLAVDPSADQIFLDGLMEGVLYFLGQPVSLGENRSNKAYARISHLRSFVPNIVDDPANGIVDKADAEAKGWVPWTCHKSGSGCKDPSDPAINCDIMMTPYTDACDSEHIGTVSSGNQTTATYISPMKSSCAANHIIVISDGLGESSNAAGDIGSTFSSSGAPISCTTSGINFYPDGKYAGRDIGDFDGDGVQDADETTHGDFTDSQAQKCAAEFAAILHADPEDDDPATTSGSHTEKTRDDFATEAAYQDYMWDIKKQVLASSTQLIDTEITDADDPRLSAITTHTIGFALGKAWNDDSTEDTDGTIENKFALDYLRLVAERGGGEFKTANNAEELAEAIMAIISKILSESATFVAPTLSVNTFNKLYHDDDVYLALFKPSFKHRWAGNIKKYQFNDCTGQANCTTELVDRNNLSITYAGGGINPAAEEMWNSTGMADGPIVDQAGAGAHVPASKDNSGSSLRNVYTYNPDSYVVNSNNNITVTSAGLSTALISNADLGVANATERTEMIRWIRGVDVDDEDEDFDTTDKRWTFGDPLHSEPIVITYGKDGSDDPINKLFVATNEGSVRMINANTGVEEWAFMPYDMLKIQKTLRENENFGDSRIYGMDGAPIFLINDKNADGIIQPNTGSTDGQGIPTDFVWMFVGMRRGGNNLYAFDVTPANTLTDTTGSASSPSVTPKLKWVIDGDSATDFKHLGETWSTPVPALVKDDTDFTNDTTSGTYNGRMVLLFGAGHDQARQDEVTNQQTSTKRGNAIYMVSTHTGERLWWASSNATADLVLPGMDYPIPSSLMVMDSDSDSFMDRIYVGDLGGQVWRIDLGDKVGKATGVRLASIVPSNCANASCMRRFFYPPAVVRMDESDTFYGGAYDAVIMASGFRPSPLSTDVTDRIYVFRDRVRTGAIPTTLDTAGWIYRNIPDPSDAGITLADVGMTEAELTDVGAPNTTNPAAVIKENTTVAAADGAPSKFFTITEDWMYDATDNLLQDGTVDVKDTELKQLAPAAGWFITLEDSGEKALSSPLAIEGRAFVTTFIPVPAYIDEEGCPVPHDGNGRIYALDIEGGRAVTDWDSSTGDPLDKMDDLSKPNRSKDLGLGIPASPEALFRPDGVSVLTTDDGSATVLEDKFSLPKSRIYWIEE
jgi:type IV pilus assembly protein PilY1